MTSNYVEDSFESNHSENQNSYQNIYDEEHREISSNSARLVAVVSYLTLLGWLVALLVFGHHKSSFATFHLRQSLGLIITGALLSLIPLIGWVLYTVVLAAWVFGLFYAIKGVKKPIPLIGDFYQNNLDFIK
jgi:uncharacterized membrane protein